MAPKAFVVTLLQAATHYMTKQRRPKGDFLPRQFYGAAVRYLSALSSLLSSIWAANANALPKDGFAQFLVADLQLMKTSQSTPLQIFCNSMSCLLLKGDDRWKECK